MRHKKELSTEHVAFVLTKNELKAVMEGASKRPSKQLSKSQAVRALLFDKLGLPHSAGKRHPANKKPKRSCACPKTLDLKTVLREVCE